MNFFLKLFTIILMVFSATSYAVSSCNNSLQQHTDSLLAQLGSENMDAILYWNLVTLQTCANDFDKSIVASPDQNALGMTRAFAIIHGAMHDSVAFLSDVLKPIYRLNSMPHVQKRSRKLATKTAVMESAYRTLYSLFPKQRQIFDAIRQRYLRKLANGRSNIAAINAGIQVGKLVAEHYLTSRQNDGSQINTPYTPILQPGYHRPDPTHPNQGFAGPHWGNVKPFLINSGSQFRASNIVGSTPASRLVYLNSTQYRNNFNEVKLIGSKTSLVRTSDQTEIGIFWAYDGAPKIGTPSRLFNQIIRVVAIKQKNTLEESAKLFALTNYAMADAIIAAWDTKYFYSFWRPVVGIQLGTVATPADPN